MLTFEGNLNSMRLNVLFEVGCWVGFGSSMVFDLLKQDFRIRAMVAANVEAKRTARLRYWMAAAFRRKSFTFFIRKIDENFSDSVSATGLKISFQELKYLPLLFSGFRVFLFEYS